MNQNSLFDNTHEKGREEWNAFQSVQDDKAGMFRVSAMPLAQETQIQSSVVSRRRYTKPHELFPKPAH